MQRGSATVRHTCIYRIGALLDEVVLYATIDDHASSQENEQGKESSSVLSPLTTHNETDSESHGFLVCYLESDPYYHRWACGGWNRNRSKIRILITACA